MKITNGKPAATVPPRSRRPAAKPKPKPNSKRAEGKNAEKRLRTLCKKASEISILCGVQVCIVAYLPDGTCTTWPADGGRVASILQRYLAHPKCRELNETEKYMKPPCKKRDEDAIDWNNESILRRFSIALDEKIAAVKAAAAKAALWVEEKGKKEKEEEEEASLAKATAPVPAELGSVWAAHYTAMNTLPFVSDACMAWPGFVGAYAGGYLPLHPTQFYSYGCEGASSSGATPSFYGYGYEGASSSAPPSMETLAQFYGYGNEGACSSSAAPSMEALAQFYGYGCEGASSSGAAPAMEGT